MKRFKKIAGVVSEVASLALALLGFIGAICYTLDLLSFEQFVSGILIIIFAFVVEVVGTGKKS